MTSLPPQGDMAHTPDPAELSLSRARGEKAWWPYHLRCTRESGGSTCGAHLSGSRLRSEIVPVPALAPDEPRRLFDLFARHYEHVAWPRFEADLAEKDCVVLLRDAATGEVCGFSTQKVLSAVVRGRRLRALFSGDTIIDPAFWGDQELIRGWCRFAGTLRAADAGAPLYWFLISKG